MLQHITLDDKAFPHGYWQAFLQPNEKVNKASALACMKGNAKNMWDWELQELCLVTATVGSRVSYCEHHIHPWVPMPAGGILGR